MFIIQIFLIKNFTLISLFLKYIVSLTQKLARIIRSDLRQLKDRRELPLRIFSLPIDTFKFCFKYLLNGYLFFK